MEILVRGKVKPKVADLTEIITCSACGTKFSFKHSEAIKSPSGSLIIICPLEDCHEITAFTPYTDHEGLG